MTESTTSTPLTTEQLAGTDAGAPAPPTVSPVPPGDVATTTDSVRPDGGPSDDVTIQGQSSRALNGTSGEGAPLLANNDEFMARWTAIQTHVRRRAAHGRGAGGHARRRGHAGACPRLRGGARSARGRVVAGDRRLHRGPAPGAAAVSRLLSPAAAQLSSDRAGLGRDDVQPVERFSQFCPRLRGSTISPCDSTPW